MATLRLSPMHARVRPDPIDPFIKYSLQTQTSWNFSGKHDRVCTGFVHCKLNIKYILLREQNCTELQVRTATMIVHRMGNCWNSYEFLFCHSCLSLLGTRRTGLSTSIFSDLERTYILTNHPISPNDLPAVCWSRGWSQIFSGGW